MTIYLEIWVLAKSGRALCGALEVGPIQIKLVAFERSVVQLSERYIGTRDLTQLTDATIALTNAVERGTAEAVAGTQGEQSEAARLIESAARMFGLPADVTRPGDEAVCRTIAGLTPYLRSWLVLRPPAYKGKRPGTATISMDRVPHAVLGVGIVAQLAHATGMTAITFQTISRIFENHGTLVFLIAHSNDIVELSNRYPVNVALKGDARRFQREYLQLIRALLPGKRNSKRSLVDLLCGLNKWEGVDRIAFLRLVGDRLSGILVRHGTASSRDARDRSILAQLRLWGIGLLSEEMIDMCCDIATKRQ